MAKEKWAARGFWHFEEIQAHSCRRCRAATKRPDNDGRLFPFVPLYNSSDYHTKDVTLQMALMGLVRFTAV